MQAEQAAARLLALLIDPRETYFDQLYTCGSPQHQAVSVVYFALVPAEAHQLPDRTVRWFPVAALPKMPGGHPEILAYALRRLHYKLEYSAVGFQVLPAKFSLSELQHTYKIVRIGKIRARRQPAGQQPEKEKDYGSRPASQTH